MRKYTDCGKNGAAGGGDICGPPLGKLGSFLTFIKVFYGIIEELDAVRYLLVTVSITVG